MGITPFIGYNICINLRQHSFGVEVECCLAILDIKYASVVYERKGHSYLMWHGDVNRLGLHR